MAWIADRGQGTAPLLKLCARAWAWPALVAALLVGGCDLEPGQVDAIVKADDTVPVAVRTVSGPVVGAASSAGEAFLGIPYAAPPVGPLRWRAPQPPAAWTAPRSATMLGPSCIQNLALDAQLGRQGDGPLLGQEDCLTLNVYAPPATAGAGRGRPVMVWLHGGAFVLGSSGQYDPSRLAREQGVVVVTVNYRLGALGFLAHPGLRGAPGEGAFGLLDQQAALRWVRDDIAEFGGDPHRVTLAGQSAGAWSACDQMASPGAAGLFSRAILESGACITPETSLPAEDAEAGGVRMAAALGCDGEDALACLRAEPATDVVLALPARRGVTGPESWAPATGLDVLPLPPREALASGRSAKVPVIDGTNADEGQLFAYLRGLKLELLTASAYADEVARLFGARAPALLAAYPADAYPSPRDAYAAVLTDGIFACPAYALDRLLARRGPVYAYEFADPAPPFAPPTLPWAKPHGSFHTAEIAFVFGTPWLLADPKAFDDAQQALSARMRAAWGAFAATGRPEGAGFAWPRFEGAGPIVELAPGDVGTAAGFGERHRCDLWERADR